MPKTPTIPNTFQAAQTARRVSLQRRFVTLSGYWVGGALAIALIGVVGVQLMAGTSWWWAVPASAGVLGLAVAGGSAWAHQWSIAHAADFIDRSNHTESALLTAIEIQDSDGEPGLVDMARRRAESVAKGVDPTKEIPQAQLTGWWSVPAFAAACVAAGSYITPIGIGSQTPDIAPIVQRAIEESRLAVADAKEIEPAALPEPERWQKALDEIEALEEELLESGDADAAVRTAAALDEAADELERQTDEAAQSEQTARDRASLFDSQDDSAASPLVERLADALSRKDMLEAEQAARELDQVGESLSDANRRELAETLEDLADRLEPDSLDERIPNGMQDSPVEPAENEPGDAEPIDQPMPSNEDTSNPSSEDATSPDPSMQQEQPEPAASEQPRSKDESVSDALRERAKDLRRSDSPPEQDPSQDSATRNNSQPNDRPAEQNTQQDSDPAADNSNSRNETPQEEESSSSSNQGDTSSADKTGQESENQSSQDSEKAPGESGSEQSNDSPSSQPNETGSEPKSGEQSSEQQQSRDGSKPEPSTDGAQSGQEQNAAEQDSSGQDGSQQERGESATDSDQNRSPEQTDAQDGQPQGQNEQQPGQQPEQQPGQDPGQQQGQEQGEQSGQQPGDQASDTQRRGEGRRGGGDQPGSIERSVREMRERQDARNQNRRVAESLRKRARDLVNRNAPGDPADQESMPDARSTQDRRLAGDDPANPSSPIDPSQFEPVDASGDSSPDAGTSDRVVGEWFDPNRSELPPAERAAARQELTKAARRARDAVDNQEVPRRYRDLIRRVFDRVQRQADDADPSAPAPAGQDAGQSSGGDTTP